MGNYTACRLCIYACRGIDDIYCSMHDKVITPDEDVSYKCDDYEYVGYDEEEFI